MIILDIETGGLNPAKHALLSIGAVDYTIGAEFYIEAFAPSEDSLDPYALTVNGFTIAQATDRTKPTRVEAYLAFVKWVQEGNFEPLLAGQQVGSFDAPFLRHIHDMSEVCARVGKWPFGHRTVDLHSVAFAKLGKSLSLDGILTALGLAAEPKPHNALTGARLERDAFKLLLA